MAGVIPITGSSSDLVNKRAKTARPLHPAEKVALIITQ